MKVKELIVEGKDKFVYATDAEDTVLIRFKDLTTAFHNIKKAVIKGKAAVNCQLSALIFRKLEEQGIATHYIATVGECEQLCTRVDVLPLQFIVRNRIAGSTARMLDVEPGTKPANVIYELRYNNPGIGCPMINEHHAVALGLATYDELDTILEMLRRTNEYLVSLFDASGIELVDFKMEFGRTPGGRMVIADAITPDNCRLWDPVTREPLDKDRYRFDLGGVCDAYREVLSRLEKNI
ncbi:MAG: phosphoribosylaminoimidazolesuccinocarboxamide synthase [Bacteroidales bacterium]|nr:phosphoribosylaminoimidazolesuccinocarboxamide synthase [Bacteroidales bacterium]